MTDQSAVDCRQDVESAELEEYLDELWFLLHHSEDDNRLVLGLTCYLDDSGSDDGSVMVTCAGPVMSRINFKVFSQRWAKMYERDQFSRYTLKPPLHMSDFVGTGKYAGLYPEFKRALFRDVAKLINEHKLYSISIAVSQSDFKNELGEDVRKNLIGPYAFAFFALVAANQTISEKLNSSPLKVAYLVDRGFGHQDQLNAAHAVIANIEKQRGGFKHTGALATETDDEVAALQAADAIAWASRKTQLDGTLPEGFEPLGEVLREDFVLPHKTIHIPPFGIKMLANVINNWIAKNGTIPNLSDVISGRKLHELPR